MCNENAEGDINDIAGLRGRAHVFRDRSHAGEVLAGMLEKYRKSNTLVLAIPAGGVPVAEQIATRLELALDVVPASKILYPWTTESGFGAVAFDGTEWLDEASIRRFGLNAEVVRVATEEAREKVRRRNRRFRGDRPLPGLQGRCALLVDDGIAAGSTMRAAIPALGKAGAEKIIMAIPTAHDSALLPLARKVDAIYCANVRSGPSFAVADAYQRWTDVSEDEVMAILARLQFNIEKAT